MTAGSTALRGRRLAESLMSATCRITTKSDGSNVTDPNTGEVTTPTGTVFYEGKCRVRPAGTQAQDVDTGGVELARYDYVISVPFAVAGVLEGHRVLVLTSPDAALVGKLVEVRLVERGDHISARRLSCEEVS